MTLPSIEAFAAELRKWWSFDEHQMHTHSWHAREDFIRDTLPDLLAAAIEQDLPDALADAKLEIAHLRALSEGRWKDAATAYLQSAGPDGEGGFKFDIQCSIVPLIAEHLAASFKAMGGENYVQMEMGHDELGPLVLTIQRKHGDLPAVVAARERERANRAEAALIALRGHI